MATPDRWMTPEEVAERLRVPRATLYAWRYKNIGPAAVRLGRHLRYRVEAVEQREVEQEQLSRAR
jgi:excisionase family DNA binding protein